MGGSGLWFKSMFPGGLQFPGGDEKMDRDLGYVRVAAVVPPLYVADVDRNVAGLIECAHRAADAGAEIAVFPELCLTGYTCADLFAHHALLAAAERGLARFAAATASLRCACLVGLPLRHRGELYNCAVMVQGGVLVGAVPKCYLPNYGEFYERRWFASASGFEGGTVSIAGTEFPIAPGMLFQAGARPDVVLAVELCEDLWAPRPPSTRAALEGATIIANLSASNDLVGKTAYRRDLVRHQSASCLAAYVYSSAGAGESTTDVVYGGHRLIAENGHVLADERTFGFDAEMSVVDIDVEYLEHERRHCQTFHEAIRNEGLCPSTCGRRVSFELPESTVDAESLMRPVQALPFVPPDATARQAVCEEIFAIQSTGLATRLRHTGLEKVVIGLSGGLDSTLALLVCVEAFRRLGISRSGILGITMPGFGTTARTVGNVSSTCEALGIALEEIDIKASCRQHFADIGHPVDRHDITFENVQARERTQILMDRANAAGALVVGTGDLSELALGWCTYNGDHMSMYAVNTGVPKTLVAFLIEYVADAWDNDQLTEVLRDILRTPISPELLPPDGKGMIAQKTEAVIGPYELHDFFLYHQVRCARSPRKVLLLARRAFADSYDESTIKRWLQVFIRRFFSRQFKRSCIPDGPKVGTLALSPRGDWRMPSDADASVWLQDLEPD